MVWVSAELRQAVHEEKPGTVLRMARQAAGLTLEELGRIYGSSASTLSRIERGRHPIDQIEVRRRLARLLGVPAEFVGLSSSGGRHAVPNAQPVQDPVSLRTEGTWVDPDAWFVQVSTFAWTNHTGTQMLDRLRDATAACTEPFSMNQDLIAFTPEIELPTYPEVAGFAHCARVKNGPDRKAGKNCYAYVAKSNALTKVELRNSGSGKSEDTLRKIAAVAAQGLREAA